MFSFGGDGLGDHVSEIWSTYFETEVGLQENPKNCLAADLYWRVISDLTKRLNQNFSIVLFIKDLLSFLKLPYFVSPLTPKQNNFKIGP